MRITDDLWPREKVELAIGMAAKLGRIFGGARHELREDLASEALVKALDVLQDHPGISDAELWVAMKRELISWYRRERRQPEPLPLDVDVALGSEAMEQYLFALDILRRLPRSQRRAIETCAYYPDGGDAAARLGVSLNAYHTLLSRARATARLMCEVGL